MIALSATILGILGYFIKHPVKKNKNVNREDTRRENFIGKLYRCLVRSEKWFAGVRARCCEDVCVCVHGRADLMCNVPVLLPVPLWSFPQQSRRPEGWRSKVQRRRQQASWPETLSAEYLHSFKTNIFQDISHTSAGRIRKFHIMLIF